jgi:hypothetical protein
MFLARFESSSEFPAHMRLVDIVSRADVVPKCCWSKRTQGWKALTKREVEALPGDRLH